MPAASSQICDPPFGAAWLSRAGAQRRQSGQAALALDLQDHAIAHDPGFAAAWAEAGLALLALGRPGEAMARLRRAIFLAPGLAAARNALGVELLRRGAPGLAAQHFAAAAQARPDDRALHHNLGLARQRQGQPAAAIDAFAAAVKLVPQEAESWHALATALHQAHRLDDALAAYATALRLRPDWPAALANLGCLLRARGAPEAAVACHDQALAQDPHFAEAHWNRALALLSLGRLAEAWEDHEWRWQVPGFPSPPRGFAAPLWNGEDIAGRTILLHAEQGFGDTLMALRYVPLVAARGADVVLEVPREMLRLALRLPGPRLVVARGEALPDFACHAPLLSLPRAFATTLDSIPLTVPYLSPPPGEVARWRDRLGGLLGLRVGLVWAGSPTHGNDANRSIPLDTLAKLFDVPGMSWVSLQAGPRTADLAAQPGGRVLDLSGEIRDFADTAAALLALDVLVTVDTSVLHLAGALGVPALALLAFAPDWRWLLGRSDSPWYPSVRLHRQPAAGDWSTPLAAVAAQLQTMPQAHRRRAA